MITSTNQLNRVTEDAEFIGLETGARKDVAKTSSSTSTSNEKTNPKQSREEKEAMEEEREFKELIQKLQLLRQKLLKKSVEYFGNSSPEQQTQEKEDVIRKLKFIIGSVQDSLSLLYDDWKERAAVILGVVPPPPPPAILSSSSSSTARTDVEEETSSTRATSPSMAKPQIHNMHTAVDSSALSKSPINEITSPINLLPDSLLQISPNPHVLTDPVPLVHTKGSIVIHSSCEPRISSPKTTSPPSTSVLLTSPSSQSSALPTSDPLKEPSLIKGREEAAPLNQGQGNIIIPTSPPSQIPSKRNSEFVVIHTFDDDIQIIEAPTPPSKKKTVNSRKSLPN